MTPKIARSRTPEIVEQQTRSIGGLADLRPSFSEVWYQLAILRGNHEIIGGLVLNTRGQQFTEGRLHLKCHDLDPLRYFLIVLRGVYLKAVEFSVLRQQMVAMACLAVTLLSIRVFRFDKLWTRGPAACWPRVRPLAAAFKLMHKY